jgi:hypothetical protein
LRRPSVRRLAVDDLTEHAQPVLAVCPAIAGWIAGYSSGGRFFFADDDISEIAQAVRRGRLTRLGQHWRERDPAGGLGPLPRVLIADEIHFELGPHWRWTPHVLQSQRAAGDR